LVEQAFRCLKGIDLLVRPIHHRTADQRQLDFPVVLPHPRMLPRNERTCLGNLVAF
jgi:hypothetical protein